MIEVRPITRDAANAVIFRWHRHHDPVRVHRAACAAYVLGELLGVAVWGNPKAPALQNGTTSEVVRLCCRGGDRNVASRLLGAAWASDRALGVRRMVSYIRADEDGVCYRAAGWVATALVKPEHWNHGNKADRWLPGIYVPATEVVWRVRWEIGPDAATTRVTADEWRRRAA